MQKLTDVYTYDPCCTSTETIGSHFFGAQIWYKNGVEHRDGDLPAVISADGSAKYYCYDGYCHRDGDLPAIESGACKRWYVHGTLHRVGGPAKIVVQPSCTEYFYYQNGYCHRDERDDEGNLLPAVFSEPSDSDEQFYIEGYRKNRDGTPYVPIIQYE
jgi:hypothetical protein